jgi:hypothetical protein
MCQNWVVGIVFDTHGYVWELGIWSFDFVRVNPDNHPDTRWGFADASF